MKKFIGRLGELNTLEREYNREKSFVVIYGRRRVGKTTLIKEFIKNKSVLYFLATEEIESRNKKRFIKSVADFTNSEYLQNAKFDNWEDIFKVFANYNTKDKKILVIDEFQYLVGSNSAFSSVFQRAWDEVLQDARVMVILCGSYISMMLSEVLSYSSPLYGRRTGQIKLNPLSFTEIQNSNIEIDFKQLVELYAVTGGVPKYLEFFNNEKGFIENIENEILSKNGFLYEEPVFLLEKEVRETMTYFSIMQTISEGKHKPSKIATTLEVPITKLSPYLKMLIELNLIEKRVPITEEKPEKSRKGLYFISDNFVAFWFKFVYPYKGELEMDNTGYVVNRILENFIDNHVSYVFEDISKQWLSRLSKKLKITFNKVGSYWDSNTEIDVVAIDKENNKVFLGECKYYKKPVTDNVYYKLVEKSSNIHEFDKYNKAYVIFSVSGFDDRLLELNKMTENLVLVDCGKVV